MSSGSTSDTAPPHPAGRKAAAQKPGSAMVRGVRVPEIEPAVCFRGKAIAAQMTTAARRALRRFVSTLNLDAASGRGFDCLITNDAEMQALNRVFLQHNYPTDVLSFPSGSRHGLIGEVAVSVDRAAAQAEEFGHTLSEELQILVLHGVLHLLGYDHERDGGSMKLEEDRLRAEYSLPNGLIGRTAAGKRAVRKGATPRKAAPSRASKPSKAGGRKQ